MKVVFVVVFLFLNSLFGTNLLDHKLFFYENSTDLVLLFDKPYNGKISKYTNVNITTIRLNGVRIKERVKNRVNSEALQNYIIYSKNSNVIIILSKKKNNFVEFSGSSSKFELRIRISPNKTDIKEKNQTEKIISETFNYFLLFAILLLVGLIIYLFYNKYKKREIDTSSMIKIISQKELDSKNRVSHIKFKDQEYLILTGEKTVVINDTNDKDSRIVEIFKSDEMLEEYMNKVLKE